MPKIPAPHHMPGIISVSKSAVYAYYAEDGIDIGAVVAAHIKAWADTVPVGTMVNIFQMLTYDVNCACPPAGWVHVDKCPGLKPPAPMEIIMDVIFPPDGSPCQVPGVKGCTAYGPLLEHSLGMIKYIQKIA